MVKLIARKMVIRKMLLHDFPFEYHQKRIVLEDGTIAPSAGKHVVLRITLETIMQKGY